jgi:hypothetical protein
MEEFGWYYDLARRWDGAYTHQGPPAAKPDSYHNWDSTGVYLLAYAQPLKKLRITGRGGNNVPQVDAKTAESLVDDGRDWGPRVRISAYADRSLEEIFEGLASWSPVVRERSAMELAKREGDHTARLRVMLSGTDLNARIGACQAAIMLKGKAAPMVPALMNTLQADDLWLRIKAAEALSGIGGPAKQAIPTLLQMLAQPDPEQDPRGMEERYLCFALFSRGGLLSGSLEGVDRQALYAAVRAGLANEDGRARGTLSTVYKNLTYEEIEPLLPAIYEAVAEPAPSGIMFAGQIRTAGLMLLARHHIKEGIPLIPKVIAPEKWGLHGRLNPGLEALKMYGGAAKPYLPEIRELEQSLVARGYKPGSEKDCGIAEIIKMIETDNDPVALRSLPQE